MSRPSVDNFLDLDSDVVRRQLMSTVGMMRGLYEVKIAPKRATRSTRANSYYFAAVVTPFFEFLRDQEPTINDREQAHIELKRQVLGTRAKMLPSGVVVRIVPSTHDMDTNAFLEYVERARIFLREQVGIETLDPGEYGVRPTAPADNSAVAV